MAFLFSVTLPLMTYVETIDYLFSRLPMFSRIGQAAYKKDLTNTIRLCEYLGNPHKKFKSIHIAGTNGKGSVSHMLATILHTAGYKTGLYTSPHLKDFRERIKVNELTSGFSECREEFVIGFTERIKPVIEEIQPSFFEITVAMAFDYFTVQNVDVAVIETGLGGRFDSTNIITPVLSVITNIGMDHMNILGDSIEKIAFEKAGIIKPGVPVVIGESKPETRSMFESTAFKNHSPIFFADEKRKAIGWHWHNHHLIVELEEINKIDHPIYELDLPGIYQTKNLITVLEACLQLRSCSFAVYDADIKKALKQIKKISGLHGRWEVVHQQPLVVLDVAHNEDGIKQLMEQVEVTNHDELHMIVGMVRDKEVENILRLFPKLANYYFTQAAIPRALDAVSLKEKAEINGLHGSVYPDVNIALQQALSKAKKDDLIIVCGSVFLVGEVNISF